MLCGLNTSIQWHIYNIAKSFELNIYTCSSSSLLKFYVLKHFYLPKFLCCLHFSRKNVFTNINFLVSLIFRTKTSFTKAFYVIVIWHQICLLSYFSRGWLKIHYLKVFLFQNFVIQYKFWSIYLQFVHSVLLFLQFGARCQGVSS